MAAALLSQGLTNVRDALRGVAGNYIANVGVSTDATAFNSSQTAIDPAGAGTNVIKAATATVVDLQTMDYSISVTGADLVGAIATISLLKGATRTDAMSRTVRAQTIGVQAGDTYTVAVRVRNQDDS